MLPLIYTAFGDTDKGLLRESNEDFFLINKEKNLFAVADGLGGLPMGDLASETAINTLASIAYENNFNLKDAFIKINSAINSMGEKIDSDFGIATTLTAIQIQNNSLLGAHVGDTGVFLFKPTRWIKLTHDDTMAQQMKEDAGEHTQIPNYYYHVLTQCIGKGQQLNPQIFQHPLEPNDRILLYSDGVTLNIPPQELHQLALQSTSPQSLIKTIINEANARGGQDNITAIAIFIQ